MLDLPRLQGIRLSAKPRFQRIVGAALLMPNYNLPPRVRIEFENDARVPAEPVLFAMNHTDRYNYWPFQYKLWRSHQRYTATWVKGKYYENTLLGKFMELANNIPTVSRGYIITRDFLSTLQRRPGDEEYRTTREWIDAVAAGGKDSAPPADVPDELLTHPRDVLGMRFEPANESYAAFIDRLFHAMMNRFVELHREAFDLGLDLIIFPQGTRSIRLSRGHIGLAEIALAFRRTIVPVGSNNCDQVYPGGSPVARGGTVTYRFGEPIPYNEMKPFHVHEQFTPFTNEAEQAHRERFQGLVDLVMDRINGLLDPRHQRDDSDESGGVRGSSRFV